jgi:Thioesterase-like superfamily
MADSIFVPSADGTFEPTEHARGPWDPRALHGGAPAALITRAFERMEPGAELPIARLGVEFLKPIPFAPLEIRTDIVRNGRRVQELTAELWTTSDRGGDNSGGGGGGGAPGEGAPGEELIGRASALRIQAVPEGLPDPDERLAQPGPEPVRMLPGPEQGKVVKFALSGMDTTSLATTGMEMSWLTDPWSLGPGKVWMRPRQPILPGEEASPLVRLVATADFGNGISSELEFDKYLFINADLTIHLWRRPIGEWIGLDAKTVLHDGGVGTAESVLHDEHGAVGRAMQTLVVQPR